MKMKGAVLQFKQSNDPKYQAAFTDLYNRDQMLAAEQEQLTKEIAELQGKVGQYKEKLNDMQKRIHDLKKQEADAIADIVSSKQIISLNDRLNNLSTELDDRNLQAIQERRGSLKAQAQLSEGLTAAAGGSAALEKELLAAGQQSEADQIFAAMVAEAKATEQPAASVSDQASRKREL
jgi:phage shock protein A